MQLAFSQHACNDCNLRVSRCEEKRSSSRNAAQFHSCSWTMQVRPHTLKTSVVWACYVLTKALGRDYISAQWSDCRQERLGGGGDWVAARKLVTVWPNDNILPEELHWQGLLVGPLISTLAEWEVCGVCGVGCDAADDLTWFLVCCCALSLLLGCSGASLGIGPIGVGWEGHEQTTFRSQKQLSNKEEMKSWWWPVKDLWLIWEETTGQTHKRFADPVVFVVKDIAVPVEQIGEELPQVVVVRLLKEVQPPHITQVGGHLFCSEREDLVKEMISNRGETRAMVRFYSPGKLSQSTSMGVARLVSPIFWYLSFKVSA